MPCASRMRSVSQPTVRGNRAVDTLVGLPLIRDRGCAHEYAVNLGGHDEIVLMQSLDLLGLQRDRGVTPTEADIRMMAFSFCEFTNFLGKGKRLPEIAKPEA